MSKKATLAGFLAASQILLTILLVIIFLDKEVKYEIYTQENIYYVKGLTLSNETNGTVIKFKTEEELARYLAHITAIDLNLN